ATIYLKQIEKNEFELPALKIEFSSKELGGPLYLNVKVWFNELTNQFDSFVYKHIPDRYAIVSYCTNEDDDPSKVNARLGANRVAKLEEFKELLGKPLVIELNQRPLREEWGRYPMVSVGNKLSPADVKEIENTVRERGEKYVRSISGVNADQAAVFVGEDTFFRAAREYKVVRSDGTWRVESVKDFP
ncbi:MAG: hypothetical protein O2856_02810, partial [Planctomycetota bacterium]|nr:hypothetical protein [Planctomycetota bacterium]